jgi:lambda family phage portal protein
VKRPPDLNLLDRLVAFVSPGAGLKRVQQRTAIDFLTRGGYEGARTDWRGSSWRVETNGANTSLYGDLSTLRRRARSLVRNNPLAKRSVEILAAHTVGCGIRPTWRTEDTAQRKRLRAAWDRFVETADARQQTTFYGLQEQAVRAMYEAGESLALLEPHAASRQLRYLVVEGEQLDHNREGVFEGKLSRLGVAFESDRQRAATGYWLFDQNPDDAILLGQYPTSQLVGAAGVRHLFRVRRPGQVRGVSELAAAMPLMRDLGDYLEAALVKARAEAAFVGVITSEDMSTGNLAQRVESRDDGSQRTYGEMAPGMFHHMQPGESVAFSQPSSNPNFAAFMLHGEMSAAAGIGVTHDQATGDLRQANYSSLRAGKVEFRRMVEMIQHLTVIPMFCAPIYRDFVAYNLTTGELDTSDARVPVSWVTPGWEPIDPLKDLQADIMAVRAGRISLGDFIASWGQDPHEQLEEIAAFNKIVDDLELVLDTDPRRTAGGGLMQQAPSDDQPIPPAKD